MDRIIPSVRKSISRGWIVIGLASALLYFGGRLQYSLRSAESLQAAIPGARSEAAYAQEQARLASTTAQASAIRREPVEFFLPGCFACEQVKPLLDSYESQGMPLVRYDVSTSEGARLHQVYVKSYGVPSYRKGRFPLIFAGNETLAGDFEVTEKYPSTCGAMDEGGRSRLRSLSGEAGLFVS